MKRSISVVIPTCNRKQRLLSLLNNLNVSSYPFTEVIIIDSGEERLIKAQYDIFTNLHIHYLDSEKSVCIQRNKGISMATGEWIFLCDDDIEVPQDYITKLLSHAEQHDDAVAVSGLVMQLDADMQWSANYKITSVKQLCWSFIFKHTVWGELVLNNSMMGKMVYAYYNKKGNHIARSGLPVVTNFSGDYFITPVYGLGASLVKRKLLVSFPYDEILEPHGIGDNYGVAINFPPKSIHVLNHAFVYHHRESINRLYKSEQYYNRIMALDYFRRTNKYMSHVKKSWLLWSLTGNFLSYIFSRQKPMISASLKSIKDVLLNNNPYFNAWKRKENDLRSANR